MKKLSSQDACRWFRSNLSELVSGVAPIEVQAEASAHRDECSDCESEHQLAVRVEQGLGILPLLSPGPAPSPQLQQLYSTPDAFDAAFRKLVEMEVPASIFASLMERIDAEGAAGPAADSRGLKVRKTAIARSKLIPVLD